MKNENPSKPSDTPQVYKQEELDMMIEMVENGIWSNKNLMTALHLAESTVIEWKKRDEVKDAHRKAILRWVKKRKDAEIALKELGLETPKDDSQPTLPQPAPILFNLTQINNYAQIRDNHSDLQAGQTNQEN